MNSYVQGFGVLSPQRRSSFIKGQSLFNYIQTCNDTALVILGSSCWANRQRKDYYTSLSDRLQFSREIGLTLYSRSKEDLIWSPRDSPGCLMVFSCTVMKVKGKCHQFNTVFHFKMKADYSCFLYQSGLGFSALFPSFLSVSFMQFTLNMNWTPFVFLSAPNSFLQACI